MTFQALTAQTCRVQGLKYSIVSSEFRDRVALHAEQLHASTGSKDGTQMLVAVPAGSTDRFGRCRYSRRTFLVGILGLFEESFFIRVRCFSQSFHVSLPCQHDIDVWMFS